MSVYSIGMFSSKEANDLAHLMIDCIESTFSMVDTVDLMEVCSYINMVENNILRVLELTVGGYWIYSNDTGNYYTFHDLINVTEEDVQESGCVFSETTLKLWLDMKAC